MDQESVPNSTDPSKQNQDVVNSEPLQVLENVCTHLSDIFAKEMSMFFVVFMLSPLSSPHTEKPLCGL